VGEDKPRINGEGIMDKEGRKRALIALAFLIPFLTFEL